MTRRLTFLLASALLVAAHSSAFAADSLAENLDRYLRPYVDSANFSGVALVQRDGKVIFEKAYGFADGQRRVANTTGTRFHVASISMQFTAAAVLRLADQKRIELDKPITQYIPELQGMAGVTVRHLLLQRSGLPDINERPDYNDILQHHQTPASLVAKVAGQPLLFPPGTKYVHEEHSAYNLLALLVEKRTGLDFDHALRKLVFEPARMKSSGVDDDNLTSSADQALGYQPVGVRDVELATQIRWSAKMGNASAYASAADQAKFVEMIFQKKMLSTSAVRTLLDTDPRVGYGWFRNSKSRFDVPAYYMNGRAPGFASFVLWVPSERLTVVVFSNIYSSATSDIGFDLTAIALGRTHEAVRLLPHSDCADPCYGSFKFGDDFYQHNAVLSLTQIEGGAELKWPSGETTPLVPSAKDEFIDRSYWQAVRLERNQAGQPVALTYDRFRGTLQDEPPR